jgi:hypothetical protein
VITKTGKVVIKEQENESRTTQEAMDPEQDRPKISSPVVGDVGCFGLRAVQSARPVEGLRPRELHPAEGGHGGAARVAKNLEEQWLGVLVKHPDG